MINQRLENLFAQTKQLLEERKTVCDKLSKRDYSPYNLEKLDSTIYLKSTIIEGRINEARTSFISLQQKMNDSQFKSSIISQSAINFAKSEERIEALTQKISHLEGENQLLKGHLSAQHEENAKLKRKLLEKQYLEDTIQIMRKNIDQIRSKLAKVRVQTQNFKTANENLKTEMSNYIKLIQTFAIDLLEKQRQTSQKQKQTSQKELARLRSFEADSKRDFDLLRKKSSTFSNLILEKCASISTYIPISPKKKIEEEEAGKFFDQLILQLQSANFLADSAIITETQSKNWLIQQLLTLLPAFDKLSTQLLYRYDELGKANFHHYFDRWPNVLLVVHLANGTILGGFTVYPFDKQNIVRPGLGLLFNLNRKLTFLQKSDASIPVAGYDDYYIVYGNSELRIKSLELKLFSNFGLNSSTFDSREFKLIHFLGCEQKQTDIESYEIYRIVP